LRPSNSRVVALAWRVHRLLINQHSVDDTAHLDQLLPVPAVAGKARHLPRRHRADLTKANLGNHALEAGADDAARRRATEVVVDGVDLRPPKCAQTIPHGVLQLLTALCGNGSRFAGQTSPHDPRAEKTACLTA
jgi:hypothetical protein